jgi:hypothetical protein
MLMSAAAAHGKCTPIGQNIYLHQLLLAAVNGASPSPFLRRVAFGSGVRMHVTQGGYLIS